MIEKALSGNKTYWIWIAFLLAMIGVGVGVYLNQLFTGLTVTDLGRDVSWGLYIAQLTFLVGVAASAVMVVLPYYLHDYKAFGKLTILGEFIAIPSVIMCVFFVVVDMGQPGRVMNLFLHPTPNSMLFWDTVVLFGYLIINIIISQVTLGAERRGVKPPKWIRPVIILSIPWAVSIHTVTAFLYSGLGARPFWMTAVLAPRFLASAFAAGPALLILLVFILKKFTKFDPGKQAVQKLAQIVTYAMIINVFLILMEVFTVLYSNIPEHIHHIEFLYFGYDGNTTLVPWMWISTVLAIISLALLVFPKTRNKEKVLAFACLAVFLSLWIDKGLGMIIAGFSPSTLGNVPDYAPNGSEILISLGIYSVGALVITILYKVAVTVRGEYRNKSSLKLEK